MALRRQSLSPTAHLLRNSRLFALPDPLPRPAVGETYGAGTTKSSDSATLPYPTHQAITTTKSSLARGDWGLKRPLPARSQLLQVGDPVLRIARLDTIEHVTDYDSAADHVRTRQKWEALGVPVVKGMAAMREYNLSDLPPNSAFERRDDTTTYDTDEGLDEAGRFLQALHTSVTKQEQRRQPFKPVVPPLKDTASHNARRWYHDGPWLPAMSADEFAAYLTTAIAQERTRFNRYLVHFVKSEIYEKRRQQAEKSSNGMPMDVAEAEAWQAQQKKQWANISDADTDAGVRALRRETANDPLNSRLVTKLILPFLKLPAIRFKHNPAAVDAPSHRDADNYQFDQETYPLRTHPSAGLGYLRTKAYLANHPLLGPQAQPSPVPARVIQPRSTASGKEAFARLGVAGFVANDEYRSTDHTNASRANANATTKDVETLDLDTEGGKKIMVQPQFGALSNDGRVWLKLKRSWGPEVDVGKGALDHQPPPREQAQTGSELLRGLGSWRGQNSVSSRGGMEMGEQSDEARRVNAFLNTQASGNRISR